MALRITDAAITSDLVAVRAEFRAPAAAGGNGAWIVSDRYGQLFTREQAIMAVQAADDWARLESDQRLLDLEAELAADPGHEEDPDCE